METTKCFSFDQVTVFYFNEFLHRSHATLIGYEGLRIISRFFGSTSDYSYQFAEDNPERYQQVRSYLREKLPWLEEDDLKAPKTIDNLDDLRKWLEEKRKQYGDSFELTNEF